MVPYPHPVFASFIFPLLSLCIVFEILSFALDKKQWHVVITVTLAVTTLCAFVSYYTGFSEFEKLGDLPDKTKSIIENHQMFAKFFLISMVPTLLFSILRLQNKFLLNVFFIIFFALSMFLGMLTSHKGGQLVFEYGIGVLNSLRNDSVNE